MTKGWIFIIGAGLFVTSCAYPQDLSNRKPFLVLTVRATPSEARDACFSDWKSGPYRRGIAAWVQYTVAYVDYLVNITPSAQGSRVEAFRNRLKDNEIIDASIDFDTLRRDRSREIEFIRRRVDLGGSEVAQCLSKLQ